MHRKGSSQNLPVGLHAKSRTAASPTKMEDDYNFEKLKGYNIPRKRSKDDHELLTILPVNGRQFTHNILPGIRAAFYDPQCIKKMNFLQAELVQNPDLEKEYLEKKRDMKDEGHLDKDSECFGFLFTPNRHEVEMICKEGLRTSTTDIASLGRADMGVYVCKHPDVIRSVLADNLEGYLIIFKIIKGKLKIVPECRKRITHQEPTPLYDCHVTKLPNDVTSSNYSRLFPVLQYYLYEYGEVDVVKRPRQVLPYVVTRIRYSSNSSNIQARNSHIRGSIDENEPIGQFNPHISLLYPPNGFYHWHGQLMVKKHDFGSVDLRSVDDNTVNVSILKNVLKVVSYLPLETLERQLPPTLLSRSGKKYNVIYRGKYYNTFTLHPASMNKGDKFSQLLAFLIQKSSVAFIPLQSQSAAYLLPISEATEKMGLHPTYEYLAQRSPKIKDLKTFLYVLIVTPKNITTRIHDRRMANTIKTRKRKDTDVALTSTIRDNLDIKLRAMNIDSSAALVGMQQDQLYKLYSVISNRKKNQQQTEKMLHHFYRDAAPHSATPVSFKLNLTTKWNNTESLQNEYYLSQKKLKVIDGKRQSTEATPSEFQDDDIGVEGTFSDEDEDGVSPTPDVNADDVKMKEKHRKGSSSSPAVRIIDEEDNSTDLTSLSNIPFDSGPSLSLSNIPFDAAPFTPASNISPALSSNKHDSPLSPQNLVKFSYKPEESPSLSQPKTTSAIRPSFQPLDELIASQAIEELYKHPEFSFTDDYILSHNIITNQSSDFPWNDHQSQLSITLSQEIPYVTNQFDCPFSCTDDVVIKSMLRAIHGKYDGSGSTTKDDEKVVWVRHVLHRTISTEDEQPKVENKTERKIVEDNEKSSPDDDSPHSAQGNSTDSGFVATPGGGEAATDEQASLKRIAEILASAISSPIESKLLSEAKPNNADDQDQVETEEGEIIDDGINDKTAAGITKSRSVALDDGVDMEISSDEDDTPKPPIEISQPPEPEEESHLLDEDFSIQQGSSSIRDRNFEDSTESSYIEKHDESSCKHIEEDVARSDFTRPPGAPPERWGKRREEWCHRPDEYEEEGYTDNYYEEEFYEQNGNHPKEYHEEPTHFKHPQYIAGSKTTLHRNREQRFYKEDPYRYQPPQRHRESFHEGPPREEEPYYDQHEQYEHEYRHPPPHAQHRPHPSQLRRSYEHMPQFHGNRPRYRVPEALPHEYQKRQEFHRPQYYPPRWR